MYKYLVTVLLFLVNIFLSVWCTDVFHVNSKITYVPDLVSEYFGYSVSLNDFGLYVGAPKARSRKNPHIRPGLVFSCELTPTQSDVTCEPFPNKYRTNSRNMRSYITSDFYKDDMWFGAVIAAISKDGLLVCAPRDAVIQKNGMTHLQGVCYLYYKNRENGLYPLRDRLRQYTKVEGARKEYEEYFQSDRFGEAMRHFPYFGTGQVGMSVAVTSNNSFLIGAPGVLLWTGTTVEYKFRQGLTAPKKLPISYPYNTSELGADNLFGYSVDSGVFDESGLIIFVSGAPRSGDRYGQVLLYEPPTEEMAPLKVKAKLVGPQLGSYFGASVCAVDIDRDGLSDILVGAPNYARKDGVLRYDQGAVIVYMSRKESSSLQFMPRRSGYVTGSGESGARFGTTVASLGDIDGDGFNDVAIGAPYENNGAGAVYIYKGNENGLNKQPLQRIQAEGSSGFGFAISKGYDVDNNKNNDVAIGAYNSGTAYLYRSIPTLQVLTSIKFPNSTHLRKNATHFAVLFCVTVPERSFTDAQIEMKAVVSVDSELKRAKTLGSIEYLIILKEKVDSCVERIIEVNDQSDLSTPILLQFQLHPIENIDDLKRFPTNMARISEDSKLQSSIKVQVLNECGDDLYCKPWLEMAMEPLASPFIPGSNTRLGVKITVENKEEPAFSVKLVVALPSPLKRLPESCSLQQRTESQLQRNVSLQQREVSLKQRMVSCALPAPLRRGENATWDFELEYAWDGIDKQLTVTASLRDPLYQRNITDGVKELVIPITPKNNVVFSGRVEPNASITITRETFNRNGEVLFTHYFKLANRGPSDLYGVNVFVRLPYEVVLDNTKDPNEVVAYTIKSTNNTINLNETMIKARTTMTYVLPLKFNISKFGDKLEQTLSLNLTSNAFLNGSHFKELQFQKVSTVLVLEPKPPIWPLIVGLVGGLLLLALIILGLYKFGFFSRKKKDEMEQLLENAPSPKDEEQSLEDTDEKNKQEELGSEISLNI